MRRIGSRVLKAQLGQVLREVREQRETYAITHRGRTIARLVPVATPEDEAERFEAVWSELDALAAEIGRSWPKDASAAQAITEDRRDL